MHLFVPVTHGLSGSVVVVQRAKSQPNHTQFTIKAPAGIKAMGNHLTRFRLPGFEPCLWLLLTPRSIMLRSVQLFDCEARVPRDSNPMCLSSTEVGSADSL